MADLMRSRSSQPMRFAGDLVTCAQHWNCVTAVSASWVQWWSALAFTAPSRMYTAWCAGAALLALVPAVRSAWNVRLWADWERRQIEEQGQVRVLAARQGLV